MHKISKKPMKCAELFGKKQAVQFSIILSFTINVMMILGILFGQTRGGWDVVWIDWFGFLKFFLWHFLCNSLLFYFLFLFNFKQIRSRIKTNRYPISSGLGTVGICFLLSPILAQIQWYVFLAGKESLSLESFMVFNLIKDLFLGILIILVTRNIYSNYKREQVIIANQKLQEENIRMRFEALKNQLDPHFLFNCLNTLNGLVGLDDEKAHEYIDNLSSVFRYTLQNKNIRTLQEEIEYVESYTALLQIRYGDNLRVSYDIGQPYRSHYIMPVSLQLLVENAVKHNVISNKAPLDIHIETSFENTVMVTNKVNPKAEKSAGGGVGLANLSERYSILFGKNIGITDLDGIFTVEIPLITETEKPRI